MIGPELLLQVNGTEMECFARTPGLSCVFGQYAGSSGPISHQLFGLLVGGGVLGGFYFGTDGGLAVPAVLTILFGTVLIPALPASYATIGMMVMFLGLVGGVLAVLVKYLTDSGGRY